MGTKLTPVDEFTTDYVVPNPAEPVRAGGGIQTAIDAPSVNNSINGIITYTALQNNVTIRLIGGTNKTLGISVAGLEITIQLGTDLNGAVTTTANALVSAITANSLANALVTPVAKGNGTGFPLPVDYLRISAGNVGSVRPPFQAEENRTFYLKNRLIETQAVLASHCYHWSVNMMSANGTDITMYAKKPHYRYDQSTPTPLPTYVPGLSQETLTSADLTPAGNFVANTWYYIYLNGLLYEISIIPPDTGMNYQQGSIHKTYVGSFRTNGSGAIIKFRKLGRKTIYGDYMIEYSNQVISDQPMNPNTFPLTYIPQGGFGAIEAELRLLLLNTGNNADNIYVSHHSGVTSTYVFSIASGGRIYVPYTLTSFTISPSMLLGMHCNTANNLILGSLVTLGYTE